MTASVATKSGRDGMYVPARPDLCGTAAGVARHKRRGTRLCATCRGFSTGYKVKKLEADLANLRKHNRRIKTQLSALLRGNHLSAEPAKVTIPAELFAAMYLTCDLDVAIEVENEVGREFVEEAIAIADQKGK